MAQPVTPLKMHSTWVLPVGLVFAGLLFCCLTGLNAQNVGGVSPPPAGAKSAAYASAWGEEQSLPELAAFQSWAGRYETAATPEARAGLVAEGVALAKQRRALLAGLIKSNPEKALALAVPASIRSRLPREISAGLESRVSGIGDLSVLGVLAATNGPAVEPIQRFVHLNGQTYRASVYGRRRGETTKTGIPLHGIVLDGVMAVHANALRELETDETTAPARPVVDLRSAADQAARLPPIRGEMGNRIYHFASREQLRRAEARLEAAEAGIGPRPLQPATEILTGSGTSGSSSAAELSSLGPSWTTGGKNVLIIRVDFSDLPGGLAGATTLQNLADTQVSPYYLKSSYQLTSVTNTVTSQLYRMPQTAVYYATNNANDQLHSDARTAAATDYAVAGYDRVIVVFSSLGGIAGSQITYGGLGDVSGPYIWCNGEFDFRVIAHELGHTYGLFHGNLWQVSDGNPISPGGSDVEYGDDFDTMGANYANSQATDFNAWFKNTLGWIAATQVVTVTTSGTYRVYAFDHDNYLAAAGETLGLKIVKDSTHNYWISCRRDFTGNPSLTNGVYVIWGYTYNRQSDLLDMTTPGSSDQDAGLANGATFTDLATAISFHPVASGGTAPNEYRDVLITFGTLPPAAPTISSGPASQSALVGTTALFPVVANGNPAPGFQWQRKPNGSSTWSVLSDGANYSGSGNSNLTVLVANLAMSGDQFQCLVMNIVGSVTSSPPATLTAGSGLVITTLAGKAGVGGNANATGTNAQFFFPYDVATDRGGNVYVADRNNGRVRKLTPGGVVSTLTVGLLGPQGVAVDVASNVYVADFSNQVVLKVTAGGSTTVLAGSAGTTNITDGTNGTARFNYPWGIAVDNATNIYVADSASSTIRKITPAGANWVVTTIAGLAGGTGSSDGTNSSARFNNPRSLAVDAARNIYVADALNNSIRKIMPDSTGTNWIVTTMAGRAGQPGANDGTGTNAMFWSPSGVTVDGAGNVFVADTFNEMIRKITPQGVVSTLAGQYFFGGIADGFYTNAQFNLPYGIAVDGAANIYVADTDNHTIRVGRFASVTIPKLAVALTNHVATVSWPVPVQNFNLQSCTNLLKTNWTAVTNLPAILNGQNYVTNPAPGGTLFFRLKNP
jgi:M6 family metalloprotease-like protein